MGCNGLKWDLAVSWLKVILKVLFKNEFCLYLQIFYEGLIKRSRKVKLPLAFELNFF